MRNIGRDSSVSAVCCMYITYYLLQLRQEGLLRKELSQIQWRRLKRLVLAAFALIMDKDDVLEFISRQLSCSLIPSSISKQLIDSHDDYVSFDSHNGHNNYDSHNSSNSHNGLFVMS